MLAIKSNPWIICPKPNPLSRLRLFCFPCAGGLPGVFIPWSDVLPAEIEVCAIQLPGRGRRINEESFTRLKPLIEALMPAFEGYLDKPFVFLGHSMGAVLAFEIIRRLRQQGRSLPLHLFACCCPAPQKPIVKPSICKLPEAAFIAELCHRYNAIPDYIREDKEMMQLFLPSLRSDFILIENYCYEEDRPIDLPISVFGGLDDRAITKEDLDLWRTQTTNSFSLEMFPGDHFFINNARSNFLSILSQKLEKLVLPNRTK